MAEIPALAAGPERKSTRATFNSLGAPETAVASGADTTAYAFERTVGDSDVIGLEFFIDAADYQAGIVTRINRGLHPGTLAEISFADSAAFVSDTRENFDATMYWLRLKGIKKLLGIGASFGYGRGHAEVDRISGEPQRIVPTRDLETTRLSSTMDQTVRFEKSDRFVVGLGRASDRLDLRIDWDRVAFDFNDAVYRGAEATVDRLTFRFDWTAPEWDVGGRLQYTDQDYGDTPPALLI